MFHVVSPPIIRSTHNCIYSIWYLSNRNWYLPLAAGSSNGLTSTARPYLDGRAMLWPWEERHGRSMAWPWHGKCESDTGKTHSKLLAVRHGRGTAWARHAMCESAIIGHQDQTVFNRSSLQKLRVSCSPIRLTEPETLVRVVLRGVSNIRMKRFWRYGKLIKNTP